MSSTTTPTDFSDLYVDLQNRTREQTGVTATENQAKRYINIALHDMHIGTAENFPWAERSAILITHPKYTTGTLAATEGSPTLTGTGTAWNTSNAQGVANMRAGGKVTVSGAFDVFEISSVSGDTTATLTSNFSGPKTSGDITAISGDGATVTVTSTAHGLAVGQNFVIDGTTSYNGADTVASVSTDSFTYADAATGAETPTAATWTARSVSGSSYTYFEDEYTLASDFLRPIDQRQFSDSIPIELISRTEFRRRWPRNSTPGRPKVATIVDKSFGSDTTPVRKIRFHNPPDEAYNIPYSYVTSNLAVTLAGVEQTQLSADTDEPIVPLRYRHAIVFHALYHWYRDKKNDDRRQEAKGEYDQLLTRIANDTEIGARHASIRPRRGAYVRRAKRPWSSGSGRYDLDNRFDRFEER